MGIRSDISVILPVRRLLVRLRRMGGELGELREFLVRGRLLSGRVGGMAVVKPRCLKRLNVTVVISVHSD